MEELRTKIAEAKNDPEHGVVEFSRDDGPFLLRFLRARKFDVDRATLLYCNYYKFRHKYADLLGDMHPRVVDHVLRSGLMGVTDLRRRDWSVAKTGPWQSNSVRQDGIRTLSPSRTTSKR